MSRPGNIPSTILHIGAGTGSELDEWLSTGAQRVILVEPNPERARELATRAAADDRIEVVQKAVATESGQLRLKRFNLPALSSLREPTGLLELFPGLRAEREIDVDTITPAELLETLPLEEDSRHWLIIDAPGEEEAIVNALRTTARLAHFNRLILHCGTDPLYSDNAPAATLLDQLQEAGYDIEQQDDTDPDRPCWSLRRNPLRLENQTLRQQVAELEQQAKELEKSRDELAREAEERKQAQEALQQEKENLGQKNGELEQQAKELEKSRDEQIQFAEKCESDLESLKAEKKKTDARLEEQRQRLKELQDQEREWSKKADEATAERAEHERQKTQFNDELTRAEGQIDLIKDILLRKEL